MRRNSEQRKYESAYPQQAHNTKDVSENRIANGKVEVQMDSQ